MNYLTRQPNVLKACTKDGLYDELVGANEKLEVIRKALAKYLEKKRGPFARFYFLPDNDLLEILSEAKNPLLVQPHLTKIFDNVCQVAFNDKKEIYSMSDEAGEEVMFRDTVVTQSKGVEYWMKNVETEMRNAV